MQLTTEDALAADLEGTIAAMRVALRSIEQGNYAGAAQYLRGADAQPDDLAQAADRLTARLPVLTVEIKRVLPASPPVVFRAFSAPAELAQWWGPEGFRAPSLEFNPRVGEMYRIEMQPPEGDSFYLSGEFRQVDPTARLAYTFAWEDPDPDDVETLVELSFRDLGESTEVVLTQGPFKTEARRELHRNGWTESFDKLERFIQLAALQAG